MNKSVIESAVIRELNLPLQSTEELHGLLWSMMLSDIPTQGVGMVRVITRDTRAAPDDKEIPNRGTR